MPMHGTKNWELLMDRATLTVSVLRVGCDVEAAIPLQHESVLLQWTDCLGREQGKGTFVRARIWTLYC